MTELVYIYTLSDSSQPDIIRYIGRTNNPQSRLNSHIHKSKKNNFHSSNWIAKVLANKNSIKLTIIHSCLPQVWEIAERFFIKYYLAKGHPLTNIELGGSSNKKRREYRKSSGVREKRIAALKNKEVIACYNSVVEASNILKLSRSVIASCARKIRPSAYGYQWEYTQQPINSAIIPIQRINNNTRRKVSQLKDNKIINTYASISDASKATGINGSNILEVCKNRRQRTAGGFIWKYI